MKWITIIAMMALLAACDGVNAVANKEVLVTSPNEKPAFLTPCSSIDVTRTTIISGSRAYTH